MKAIPLLPPGAHQEPPASPPGFGVRQPFRQRGAPRNRFVHLILILLWACASPNAGLQAAGVPFPTNGIAARYPGDQGIERDDRVVFVEDFEEATLDALWKRWDTVGDRPGQSFATDVPAGSAGKHSLVMEREKGPGAQLYRRLKNKSDGWGYDRLFARYYVKFAPDCGEIHR